MNIGVNTLFFQICAKNTRIASGNLLALKPLHARIVDSFGDSQRKAAFAEAQTTHHIGVLATLHKLIFTHDAEVGHTRSNALWNIIVAQIKDFNREIGRFHEQSTLARWNLDARLSEQGHSVFEETALGLNSNSYHFYNYCIYFLTQNKKAHRVYHGKPSVIV